MGNRKQPEVRFKGFTEEWEECKLGDIFKKIRNAYVGSVTQFYVENKCEGKFYLESNNVKNGMINTNSQVFINDYFYMSQKEKWLHTDDMVMVQSGHVGHTAVIPEEFNNSAAHALIMFQNPDIVKVWTYFLNYEFQNNNYKKKLSVLSTGNTIKHILASEMVLFQMNLPNIKEQQKIGTFFKQLDDKIALQERQIELLKEQKKGFLQKMFPKTGERTPEVRFAGYMEEWEKRKLGEISDIVGGGTPSTSQQNYWDGEIDWYSPAEIGEHIYMFGSNKKITELGLKKSSAKVLPIGTVLFTSRAGIGNTAILKKEGATNQGFQSILPKKNILDSYFIFSRTKELKRYGEVTGAGSTFIEVSGKQMEKMVLKIPSYNEQVDLGKFFKKLDDNITLNQKELKILKQIKKGF